MPPATEAMPDPTISMPSPTTSMPNPSRSLDGNNAPQSSAAPSPLSSVPFSELDRDDDGRVTEEESDRVPQLSESLRDADIDKSGSVNANEFERANRNAR